MTKQSIEIPFGEERTIVVNALVEFVLTMREGTEVNCFITPNNPLKLRNGGGIESANIFIREAPGGDFNVVS